MIDTFKDLAPLLSAAAAVVVGLIGVARGTGRVRAELKVDAEIATALLTGNGGREKLLAHIERRIDSLIADETTKTRDWPILVVTLFVTPGLAALTVFLVQHGTWWSYLGALPTGLITAICVYGLFETSVKAERDEKGNRI
jgi:hypothetical protein